MTDDEAILAGLDADPDAFALFYRRHAAALLEHFVDRTYDRRIAAELFTETFAAALADARDFERERGSAEEWLYAIARRLLDDARRRGVVEERARRRLGLPELVPGDRLLDELEEELVEAARFRAERRRRRPLPRPPVRALLGAAAVLAAVAVAALALGGDDDGERAATGATVASTPPRQGQAYLLEMLPLRFCAEPTTESLGTSDLTERVALLRRPQRPSDEIAFLSARLPIGSFDADATRLAAHPLLRSALHVVPSSHVATDGRCGSDDGPGACLVASGEEFRCFTSSEVRGGVAVARTAGGMVVGLAPDGVARVTIQGIGPTFGVEVSDNVYTGRAVDMPTTQLTLSFHASGDDGCRREVTAALTRAVPVLRDDAQPGLPLPGAAIDALSEWGPEIDAIVDDRARQWGGDEGVDFWAVPVVARGGKPCAPADRACVVAIAALGPAHAACGLRERDVGGEAWVVAQIMPRRSVIWGTVPVAVTAAAVTIDHSTAPAEAGSGVIGEVLPIPYGTNSSVDVHLVRGPVGAPAVGVVDASGITGVAENVRAVIRQAGYAPVPAPNAAPEVRAQSLVLWRRGNASRFHAARLATLLRADVERIRPRRSPEFLLRLRTPVVVVVGSEP
jgi:DNA-directed RNA polymerase specialized sigma24 family protein